MRTMGVKGLTLYHLKTHLQVSLFALNTVVWFLTRDIQLMRF